MPKLLHLIATPREEASRTLQVSEAFLEVFTAQHPDWEIDELNLSKEQLPSLSMKRVDGKYVLLEGKNLYGQLEDEWEDILRHINRFLTADLYLISTPMWNFSIPYMLKHYIDIIVQPTFLFRYAEDGSVEGLVKNRKMVVITSRGDQYKSNHTRTLDLQEPYLRTIFGFVGITDIRFVIAEPMDMGVELQKQKISEAIEAAKTCAAQVLNA